MGDSDDEYDRKRRDKFRGERSTGDSYRTERRDDRRGDVGGRGGRDDWGDRNPFRGGSSGGGGGGRPRPDYRDYRGGRDRYGSPGREMPPTKRMRSDWGDDLRGNPRFGGYDPYLMQAWNDHYAAHSLHAAASQFGGHAPPHHSREAPPPSGDTQTQPAMMTLKQFLDTQDDGISDSEVLRKYSDYKLEFKRQQLNEFFVAHKDEEWFKNKYHPVDSVNRKEEQLGFLKRRVEVFNEVLDNGTVKSVSVDTTQTDPLLRLLDTIVIRLEGGTDDDLRILDEKPSTFDRAIYSKRNDHDDDVIITSVESKKPVKVEPVEEEAPVVISPRPVQRAAPTDDEEENWDDDEEVLKLSKPAAVVEPAVVEEKKSAEEEKKEKKSLKRKRSRSDSSSSSSSDSSSSSSSSDDDDADDDDKPKAEEKSKDDEVAVEEDTKTRDGDEDDQKSKHSDDVAKDDEETAQSNGVEKSDVAESVEEAKLADDDKASSNGTPKNDEVDHDNDDDDDGGAEKTPVADAIKSSEEKESEQKDDDEKKEVESAVAALPKLTEPTETIDLDTVKDKAPPRALHRTSSIFLRNLAPSITKAEIETVCQRFDGYLRVAIADPLVERRWYRRGWVTFRRDVNIKEICWSLNNTRLKDCEMGAIVNRDLSRRVRPVNGMTAHKMILRADIKLCAKIAMNLDDKFKLWDTNPENTSEAETKTNGNGGGASNAEQSTSTFGFQSNNPVLQNITDYLIEEASAEEDELLGISGDNKDGDGEVIERDPQLIAVLDHLILYLRIVHSVDFYNHCEYPYEDEMPNRCGIIHARGPIPSKVTQNDMQDYIKNFENKMQTFLAKTTSLEDEELKNLGSKDCEAEVEKFIQANTQELAKDKWLCPLSGKKFKGPEFIRKHIFNKHMEKVDEVRKEVEYFNNYLRDPKRPQLPEHPGTTKRTNSESSGGYRPPMYPPAYAPPYAAYAPPMMMPGRGGRFGGVGGRRPGGSGRQLIQYRDLDAPQEPNDIFN